MNRIDFLPARYREARAARQSRWWGGAVIVAFGGLVGAAFVGQKVVQYRTRQEIATAEIDFNAAKLAQQQLESVQKQARDVNVEAELVTYLRHPWPRTQVLRRITAILPQEVTLERMRIGRDENKPKDQLTLGGIKPADPAKPTVDTSTPAEKDLKRLREECDTRRVVVELTGYTSDLTALHVYLNNLARETLFAQAELTSIQSVEKSSARRSQFTARLVLAPGYGQRGATDSPTNGAQPPVTPATAAPSSVTLQVTPHSEAS